MKNLNSKLDALETETQLKINRQFLKRIETLEKRIVHLESRLEVKIE